ncbi:MAG: hypothetical protein QOI60_1118 [Actinomycetota bacterium]|nr:hypothetical protein [Actinomycetota bacterium]
MSAPPLVVYADPSPSGLAAMLGGLIDQNLARQPGRLRLLKPSVFAVEAPDADVAVTLHVGRQGVRVADGIDPSAQVRVRADSARLLMMAGAPLRFGLPDVLSLQGRDVIADIARGRVRITGLVLHPVRVARLTTLLSAR